MAAIDTPPIPRAKLLAARLLDLVFPPLCIKCRAPVSDAGHLCADCWLTVAFLDGPCCVRCGLPFEIDPGADTTCAACYARPPAFDCARAVMRYEETSSALILGFKRADRLELAPPFARWLERSGRLLLEEADLIVPVPLHPWRLWQRRFNQSAILAQALSESCGIPSDPLLLRRLRPTPSQGAMPSAKARRRNVHGAFRVAPGSEALRGRNVLLVDDVMTTGATADACARALKRAGAAKVFALSLARVVRPQTDII